MAGRIIGASDHQSVNGNAGMTVDETRERLIRLETQFEHMAGCVEKMEKQVDAMHDLLMQAKGARWLIVGLASIGGFIAAFVAKMLPIWPVR